MDVGGLDAGGGGADPANVEAGMIQEAPVRFCPSCGTKMEPRFEERFNPKTGEHVGRDLKHYYCYRQDFLRDLGCFKIWFPPELE